MCSKVETGAKWSHPQVFSFLFPQFLMSAFRLSLEIIKILVKYAWEFISLILQKVLFDLTTSKMRQYCMILVIKIHMLQLFMWQLNQLPRDYGRRHMSTNCGRLILTEYHNTNKYL